jgi:hypothetical protein
MRYITNFWVVLMLVITGGVLAILITISPKANGSGSVQPQSLSLFRDLERVPIYPGARVVRTEISHDGAWRTLDSTLAGTESNYYSLIYIADASYWDVLAFHDTFLPAWDWTTLYDYGDDKKLTWTDPNSTQPWHLALNVVVNGLVDPMSTSTPRSAKDKETQVQLILTRYPDTSVKLPVYPNSYDITGPTRGSARLVEDGAVVTPITQTYRTRASFKEIEDYYNSTMVQYGWEYAEADAGPTNSPNGRRAPSDALYFRAVRPGSGSMEYTAIFLSITAFTDHNGVNTVTMRVEEW